MELEQELWDAQEVVPSLYLGSEDAAHTPLTTLHEKNITHILIVGFGLDAAHAHVPPRLHSTHSCLPFVEVVEVLQSQGHRLACVSHHAVFRVLLSVY